MQATKTLTLGAPALGRTVDEDFRFTNPPLWKNGAVIEVFPEAPGFAVIRTSLGREFRIEVQ